MMVPSLKLLLFGDLYFALVYTAGVLTVMVKLCNNELLRRLIIAYYKQLLYVGGLTAGDNSTITF